ncbi:MAG: DUF3796 domain-containing protein [Atopobium sp.]|uniref:DUF3796 domain-containing protein n=1 Tax=Atopobium sp. TaxID=1872650 RepID=UPI002A747A85|nr:DUF3796 domain-containing protein [Atopobium sp.]MDY2787922.1 DUF3796 domain-containing protein [Atopobium sp.]
MKKKINIFGFLSILSVIAILGKITGNSGWYGFLGFLYYLRYFWVIPDEAFIANIQKAASAAFLLEMIALIPFVFICFLLLERNSFIPSAFGMSFAVAMFSFTIILGILEWKEQQGIGND